MIDCEEREQRFARLADLGEDFGINITPCRCKNPTLAREVCGIAGPLSLDTPKAEAQGEFSFTCNG